MAEPAAKAAPAKKEIVFDPKKSITGLKPEVLEELNARIWGGGSPAIQWEMLGDAGAEGRIVWLSKGDPGIKIPVAIEALAACELAAQASLNKNKILDYSTLDGTLSYIFYVETSRSRGECDT